MTIAGLGLQELVSVAIVMLVKMAIVGTLLAGLLLALLVLLKKHTA